MSHHLSCRELWVFIKERLLSDFSLHQRCSSNTLGGGGLETRKVGCIATWTSYFLLSNSGHITRLLLLLSVWCGKVGKSWEVYREGNTTPNCIILVGVCSLFFWNKLHSHKQLNSICLYYASNQSPHRKEVGSVRQTNRTSSQETALTNLTMTFY